MAGRRYSTYDSTLTTCTTTGTYGTGYLDYSKWGARGANRSMRHQVWGRCNRLLVSSPDQPERGVVWGRDHHTVYVVCRMAKRRSSRLSESAAKRAKLEEPVLQHDLQWTQHGRADSGVPQLVVLDGSDALHSVKVAGFDIDWTIVKTKSGRKFPTGSSDWQFLFDEVPLKLRELHESGTKVVFFTNQAGIEKHKTTIKELCDKVEAILAEIGIPIQVFMCTGNTHFRKPSVEMWRYMEQHCNGGVKILKENSFFVGDAAGRAKNWAAGKPKDFSAADRMFAANVGVKFYTPEEFFLGEREVPYQWGALDPKAFLESVEGKQAPKSLHSDVRMQGVLVIVSLEGIKFCLPWYMYTTSMQLVYYCYS